MKKVYTLFYSDYDGHSEYKFIHPNNKLKAEFQQDVQDLLIKHTPELVANGGKIENRFCTYKNPTWIGTPDLITTIAKHLPELGYLIFEEQFEIIDFGFFGGSIIKREDEKESILDLLPDDITESIYANNDRVEAKLNKRLHK